jgi:tetratricopeptide (TPR) repeat protein
LDEANEKYPDALQEYRKELDYSSDARARSSARLSVAGILWQLGNYAEARKMLDATEAEASPFQSIRLELSQARAAMALSEGDYADARAQSREALAAATQEPPRAAALRFILGQAQIATGNSHQGVANCEEAFRDVEKQGNAIKMRRARLILALARMDAGDRAGALQLLNDLGSATAPYPESNWWVLALKARLDPRTIAEARQALDQVRKAWGDAVFQRYQSRPDIQKLSRPLFASSSAK